MDSTKKQDLVSKIQSQFDDYLDALNTWRERAQKEYRYVAGDQYSDEDLAVLQEEGRPDVTFNRLGVYVQMVCGLEIANRQQVTYLARKPGPAPQGNADILNAAADYFSDECAAGVHHGAAFRDLVICGIGCSDTEMDYERNPDGMVTVSRRDPLNVWWDFRASQPNLQDRRFCGFIFRADRDWVFERWPEVRDSLTYTRAFDEAFLHENRRQFAPGGRGDDYGSALGDRRTAVEPPDEVIVCKYQYYVTKTKIKTVTEKGEVYLDPAEWRKLNTQYPELSNLPIVRIPMREYRQAYVCGDTLLEDEKLPVQGDFTIQFLTGLYDEADNSWYGLVKSLLSPQEWVNKLYNQMLHIINSNSKGGLYAERDAFENPIQAELDFARPDRILWTRPGAIIQGKIKERAQIPYPAASDKLLQVAMEMFPQVTGINLELLGLADRVQAGVLEAQRKQSGVTILGWAFDALRAYRRSQGKLFASFIRDFIADGRLIRLLTEGQQQYVPLVRDQMASEYDVVVAESPTSVSEKDRVLMLMTQVVPVMAQYGMPPPPLDILDYLPLPADLIEKWKAGGQNEQANQAQMMAMQEQVVKLQKESSTARLNEAKRVNTEVKTQGEMLKIASGNV